MWESDHKEGWALKNWCSWTVVLEKTLESPLDCKEIKPVNPKGNQPWIFIRRTDAEAETPILWPPDVKSQLIRKDCDGRKDWRQEKGTTEDEMVGLHHQFNRHEFEHALEMVKDREAWCAAIHGVTKSWTWLSDLTPTTNLGESKHNGFEMNGVELLLTTIHDWYLSISNIPRGASLVAQIVKNLPAMQETQVGFLGQEGPLEKQMATHFRILTWRIPWTEEPGRLYTMGSQRVGHSWATNTHNGPRIRL